MRDQDMVAAIVAGDPAGLQAAFDRYAGSLYGYCLSLLAEPADAADVVQDTFVIAAEKLAALRDPGRLRPWLYAVARNECHRRMRAAPGAPLDEDAQVSQEAADPGTGVEQAERRELVREALRGLSPAEREIIELSLGHELAGADLADALGVPRNQAHAMASRARAHFEAALGVLLVARAGQDCGELAAMLRNWDGQLTVLLRKRVARHIRRCPRCGARQRHELNPETLLGLLPAAALPAALRHQVLSLLADPSPAAAAQRLATGQRVGPLGPGGFPHPLDPPHAASLLMHPARAATAAAAGGAVAAGAMLVVVLPHRGQPPEPVPPVPSVAVPAAGSGALRAPAVAPGGAHPAALGPAAQATSPATSPAGLASTGPAGRLPRVSVSVSATLGPAAAAQGRLVISPARLDLRLSLASPATATLTLTAVGGPVRGYQLAVPAAFRPLLSVSRTAGSLAAGHSVRVTVAAAAALLPGTILRVASGGQAVPVPVQLIPGAAGG
jgi:RNA polymerase sigma factor (sigma-70 family)